MPQLVKIILPLFLLVLVVMPIIVDAAEPSIFNIWQGTDTQSVRKLESGEVCPLGSRIRGEYCVGTCNVVGYCTFCHSLIVTRNIVNFIVQFSMALSIGLAVWGALKIIISGGKPQLVQEGRKTVTSAIIGLVIILTSWIIVNTVLHIVVGAPNFPWNTITCY